MHISKGLVPITVAVVFAMGATSCNGDAPGAESTTTPPAPATTAVATTTSVVPGSPEDKAAVIATIDRFWQLAAQAKSAPNGSHPELLAVAEGKALESVQGVIQQLQQNSWTVRRKDGGPSPHAVTVVSMDGDHAKAWECVVDDGVTYDTNNNVIDEAVLSFTFDVELERGPTGWIVSDRTRTAQEQGRGLCEMLPQQ